MQSRTTYMPQIPMSVGDPPRWLPKEGDHLEYGSCHAISLAQRFALLLANLLEELKY